MKKEQTLIERYKAIHKIGTEIAIPYHVWTKLGSVKSICVIGDEVGIGEDFCTVEEARTAIEWYATQLGGKVTWVNEK